MRRWLEEGEMHQNIYLGMKNMQKNKPRRASERLVRDVCWSHMSNSFLQGIKPNRIPAPSIRACKIPRIVAWWVDLAYMSILIWDACLVCHPYVCVMRVITRLTTTRGAVLFWCFDLEFGRTSLLELYEKLTKEVELSMLVRSPRVGLAPGQRDSQLRCLCLRTYYRCAHFPQSWSRNLNGFEPRLNTTATAQHKL